MNKTWYLKNPINEVIIIGVLVFNPLSANTTNWFKHTQTQTIRRRRIV